jgi:hypothetical protein
MWLSLICTKLKEDADGASLFATLAVAAKNFDVGTPPATVQSRPVPAHAMQLRKFRRSMPSSAGTLAGVGSVDMASVGISSDA